MLDDSEASLLPNTLTKGLKTPGSCTNNECTCWWLFKKLPAMAKCIQDNRGGRRGGDGGFSSSEECDDDFNGNGNGPAGSSSAPGGNGGDLVFDPELGFVSRRNNFNANRSGEQRFDGQRFDGRRGPPPPRGFRG